MTPEQWALFFEVFNASAAAYAIAAGVAFGATALLYITLRFPPRIPMSTPLIAGVITAASIGAGSLFFAGQIVQAISTDPSWPRALARAGLWEVFSLAIGTGLAIARSFAHRVEH